MLFGVPSNKWELLRGRIRWAFPFLTRNAAESHFEAWLDTLCRWRGVTEPKVLERKTADGSPQDVYRRAGVPHLWLLDPEMETVEEYTLAGRAFSYERAGMEQVRASGRSNFPGSRLPLTPSSIRSKNAMRGVG